MQVMRIRFFCFPILTGAMCFAQGASPAGASSQSNTPVAIVGGQTIGEDELLRLVQGQMRQLRSQEYEAKRRALDELINQRLTETEAEKRGLTAEEFLRQEVDAKLADPSDAELEAFYFGQRNPATVPFEQ